MAIYLCNNCDAWVDDDWHPMEEHPWANRFERYQNEVVCPECATELREEALEVAREEYNQ